jgi:hypothetical protein
MLSKGFEVSSKTLFKEIESSSLAWETVVVV